MITLAKEHKRQQTVLYDPSQRKNVAGQIVPTRRKRVAAYARVSTELDSQQNSYEAQIDYYTNYIQNNPDWEFVRVYADEGITGTSYKKRDGFNKMVEDATSGKIDLILTKSISRFARNTVDALTITRQLKSENIEVYFEKENISSMDAQAELIFTIMSSIAQEESRSISQNVRWGVLRSMEAGRVTLPWARFLGFEKGPDGLPQIVEEEAEVVRRIYRDYLSGETLHGIARSLEWQKVKTASGKGRWTAEVVRHILTNEKYKGDAILQKTYTVDFLSKEIRVNNGERKQWYIRDSHDAIITPEAFQLVQAELKRRGRARGRYFPSPFSGNLYCGKCGAFCLHRTYFPDENSTRGRSVWACSRSGKEGGGCDVPMVGNRKLERAALIALNRLLGEYEFNEDGFREVMRDGDWSSLEPVKLESLDAHVWHTLVEYAELMADGTVVFRFRNGRKEAVPLN